MATDFTGTNSEKIDKMVATIIELRTTLRICFAIIGVGFPLMIGLMYFPRGAILQYSVQG